ncbi:hypothetical protein BGZ63DRAFT_362596 [Mariannaea sp. PMI_226]|nr:hypothetical protein BGZ63DRAFT_362596 [Mariannaea sp. PMI_226]
MYPNERPPRPPPSQSHSSTPSLNQPRGLLHQHRKRGPKLPTAPSSAKSSRSPSISTPNGKNFKPRHRRSRQRHSRRSQSRSSGSSTYSNTRPSSATQQPDSGSTSEEDPIVFRNARQFPPLLPSYPAFGSPGTDSKVSVQNRITTWVTQYEGSRIMGRRPPIEVWDNISSKSSEVGQDENTTGSETSGASSVEEIEELWTKLKEKRAKLNGMKFEMAKRRKDLRDLRRRKDEADNAFMGVIRPLLVNQKGHLHTPANLLERRLGDMQSLRMDYHFLESEYEGLEVMLDEEEAELNSLETRFFSLLGAGRTRPKRLKSDTDSETERIVHFRNMPLDLKGIAPTGPSEDHHPLYTELLSIVGDLEIAKEEYEELLLFKEQYDYDIAVNGAAGKPEDEDAIEFMAEYPSRKQKLTTNIAELQEAVARLRKLCEEKEVLPKHLSARVGYLLYPEREYGDMDLDDVDVILEQRPNLAHHKFPVLLTQPEHVLAKDMPHTPYGALRAAMALPDNNPDKRAMEQLAAKECAIDRLLTDRGVSGKADSVNRWLLQQLRISPVNAVILYLTFITKNSLKIRDFWRWQSDVLHYWWRDDVASLGEDSSKLVTSQGSRCASGVGTSPPSRAASDGLRTHEASHWQHTQMSESKTAII